MSIRTIDINEIEYSCSPGGVDCWEVSENGDFLKGDFLTAIDAIGYVADLFHGQELNITIKSLEWYHNQVEG